MSKRNLLAGLAAIFSSRKSRSSNLARSIFKMSCSLHQGYGFNHVPERMRDSFQSEAPRSGTTFITGASIFSSTGSISAMPMDFLISSPSTCWPMNGLKFIKGPMRCVMVGTPSAAPSICSPDGLQCLDVADAIYGRQFRYGQRPGLQRKSYGAV